MIILWNDLRYALRTFRKNPGFVILIVLTLAIGIGANTVGFSVVQSLLFRPLPFKNPEQLVSVFDRHPEDERVTVTYLNFLDWQTQNQVFEKMAVFCENYTTMSLDSESKKAEEYKVSTDFFSVLGVSPLLGRVFTAEEGHSETNRVAILSYSLWNKALGKREDILGKTISIDGYPHQIIGVMPSTFEMLRGYSEPDFWTPIDPKEFSWSRDNHALFSIARLKPGVTLGQAQANLTTIAQNLSKEYPKTNSICGVKIDPLYEPVLEYARPLVALLFATVFFILLICWANISNILLARSGQRMREVTVRIAVGANRMHIMRQFLTESVLLSLSGGAAGLLFALWGVESINTVLVDMGFRPSTITISIPVLWFTFALSVLSGIAFGFLPSLRLSNVAIAKSLKENSANTSSGTMKARASKLFVISEIALSLILLVGAGLLTRSFVNLLQADPGFHPAQILSASIDFPKGLYSNTKTQAVLLNSLSRRISNIPGVTSVAVSRVAPCEGQFSMPKFTIEEHPTPNPDNMPCAGRQFVSINYFQVMAIPLKNGRFFNDSDQENALPVVLINEEMQRKYWGTEPCVGGHLNVWGVKREIIGVVGNVKQDGISSDAPPLFYIPYTQANELSPAISLLVRASGSPSSMIATIRQGIQAETPNLVVTQIRPLEETLDDSIRMQWLLFMQMSMFSAIALLLAVIGVFGVVSHSVSVRVREIGIRIALGAKTSDVMKMIIGQSARLILIGVLLGTLGSLAMARFLSSLLYGVNPIDPVTLLTSILLLSGIGLFACYIPARRAAKVDPMTALRYE